jgi:hypothetical protein
MAPSATYESGHFYFAQTGHSHFAATLGQRLMDIAAVEEYISLHQ